MHHSLPTSVRDSLQTAGLDVVSSVGLAGDVSARRYHRATLAEGHTAVVAVYPTEPGWGCRRWLETSALLQGADVRVPEILAADCGASWMALEDVGSRTLYEAAGGWRDLPDMLEAALDAISRIGTIETARIRHVNADLDAGSLEAEIHQTVALVLEPRDLLGSGASRAGLLAALGELVETLAADERRPCHRDFMARNLVPGGDSRGVVVLDHQDLRLGPPMYDLASLLNDSLFADETFERGVLDRLGLDRTDRTRYHRAAAQRTLKIAGTFAAFARRGEARHLPLIEPALAAAARHLRSLPGLRDAAEPAVGTWPAPPAAEQGC